MPNVNSRQMGHIAHHRTTSSPHPLPIHPNTLHLSNQPSSEIMSTAGSTSSASLCRNLSGLNRRSDEPVAVPWRVNNSVETTHQSGSAGTFVESELGIPYYPPQSYRRQPGTAATTAAAADSATPIQSETSVESQLGIPYYEPRSYRKKSAKAMPSETAT